MTVEFKGPTQHVRSQSQHDWNARVHCPCAICRTGSVFADGVAAYCEKLYLELTNLPPCACKATVDLLDRAVAPHLAPKTFRTIVEYIDNHLFRHYLFDFDCLLRKRFVEYQQYSTLYRGAFHPIPQPFQAIDYLRQLFRFLDQFLDLSTAVWVHFIWILNTINKRDICLDTFIPVVWTTVLIVTKLCDDVHFDNRTFMKAINYCIVARPVALNPTKLASDGFYYNPHLEQLLNGQESTVMATRMAFVTLPELALLEELLLVDVLQFNVLPFHDRTEWPLFTCWCLKCQPFHTVYSACARSMSISPTITASIGCFAMRQECLEKNAETSGDYLQFIEMFYLRLRQSYNGQQALPQSNKRIKREDNRNVQSVQPVDTIHCVLNNF